MFKYLGVNEMRAVKLEQANSTGYESYKRIIERVELPKK